MKKLLFLLILLLSISFISCSKDDSGTNPVAEVDPWVGTWISADANVAPILVALFKYDSVRVTMNEDKTVQLDTHIKDGAWASIPGVYTVTKSTSGNVHSININYSAFEQGGIIEVISGTPDQMKLEVVQTVPANQAVPRTPESGFGSDESLGTINIQKYIRVD